MLTTANTRIAARGSIGNKWYKVFVDPTTVTSGELADKVGVQAVRNVQRNKLTYEDLIIEYEEDGALYALGEDPMELQSLSLTDVKFHLSFRESVVEEDDGKHPVDIPTEDKYAFVEDPNWKCEAKKTAHDIFISYRVAANAQQVELLRQEIENATSNHVFYDKRCLVPGEPWARGFMQGLLQSKVIVPICSTKALEKMERAHKENDNMLLEWELALEIYMTMKRNGSKIKILPVMLDNTDNSQFRIDFSKFPEDYPHHPSSLGKYTIQKIIKGIFEFQGRKTSPNTIRDVIPDILKCANAPPDRLSTSELQQLSDWLKPTSTEDDRIRIAGEHVDGTRDWLLQRLQSWKNSSETGNNVLWLQGVAGIGKSVMAAFAARKLEEDNSLGACFFCKHNDQTRNDASILINSVAYSLAAWNGTFGRKLMSVMADDPDVGSARLDLRFKVLLREPLELVRDAQTVVLVFDALDECVGRGRPDILRIIRTEFQNLPPFVKLFVTSRPEPDIVAAFSLLPYQIIEPNSKENLNDIRVYARCRLLQTSFSNAQLKRLVDKLEQLVTRLADSSGGIFVWTKVALDMIDRENTLEGTLAILDELPIDTGDLYVRVFEAALGDNPSPILPSLMQTIVTVLQPLSPTALAELMGESLVHIEAAAATLAGVLVMDNGKLRLLHKSVADFLTDPSNSANPFYVDVNETNHRLARWCLQRLLLDGVLRPNICKLDPRFFNATQYLPSRIAKNLPEDVQYSCQFWMRHLALSKGSSDEASGVLVTLVADLYVSKLLVWLEVLAVLDALDIVTRYTSDIEVWWRAQYRVYAQTQLDVPLEGIDNGTEQVQSFTSSKQSKSFFSKWWRKQTSRSPQREALVRYHEVIHSRHREVETLMSDALRFVMAFRIPIRLNTPHLYLSALPFTPIGSALYQIYHPNSPRNRTNPIVPFTRRDIDGNQFRDIPTVSHGLNADWANNLFTLEGHSDNVTAVAISGDGKFAVTAADDSKVGVWEMASGSLVRLLEVDARLVAIGNDGALVVTVELPDVVKIWESATGIVINTMGEQSNPHPLTSIAVHDSGARVGTGSSDGKVKVWSIANGSVRRTFVCAAKVSSVAFRNQGYLIVALCDDGTAMTWDYKTGSCVNTVRLGGLMKQISAISDNGEHLVTCGPERITIHSTCGTRPTKKIETRSDTLTSVVVSRDGERIALVTLRGIVVWNCFQRKISHMLDHPDVTYMANGVAFSRDGESLISGSVNGTVKVWELTSTPILIGLPLDRSIAMPWAFSREGRTICMVVGERDSLDLRRFFEIRDMEEGSHLMTVAADEVGLSADDRIIMQSLAVSGDGKRIVCGWERKDGQFETMWYDARSKSVWRRTADDRLIEVAMSEDGKCFITFSTGNIHVYEVADVNQDGAADVRLYCRYPADDYADVQGEFGHVFHRRWSHKVVYTEDGWVKELIRDDDTVIVGWAPPQYRRGDGAVAAHGDRVALLGQHVAFVIGWI